MDLQTTNNEAQLLFNLAEAWTRLSNASKNKHRQAHHEQEYGEAYQACVRAGLLPQVRASKRRYRYSPGHGKG